MPTTSRQTIRTLAILVLVTVATQIFYITVVYPAGDGTQLRPATWLVETLVFSAIAVTGTTLAIRNPQRAPVWMLVALFGLFNVVQVSMGLSMFGPADKAQAVPELIDTVVSGAFSFYYLAKLLLAVAAVAMCYPIVRSGVGLMRILAALTLVASAAGIVTALLAMLEGREWLFQAGGAGTAVAALFGVTLLFEKEA